VMVVGKLAPAAPVAFGQPKQRSGHPGEHR
jgi:hypothetical protein